MSDRVRTSRAGELIVKRIQDGLDPAHVSDETDKWRIFRLALAVSVRIPVQGGDTPDQLKQVDRSGGSEYRLKQLTGEGKRGPDAAVAEDVDLTDTLRAMLGALHDIDLFHPDHRESTFLQLLEYHLERGLTEIERKWKVGEEFLDVLLGLLPPPDAGVKEALHEVATERITAGFAELGITVEVRGPPVDGPRLTHVSLHVPNASDLDRIATGLHRLAFVLGLPPDSLQVLPSDQPKTLTLVLPRPKETWRIPTFSDLQDALRDRPDGLVLPMCLGVDTWGHPLIRDLVSAPHLLLGGATGSGKSVALHALLSGLLLSRTREELKLVLCDAKGTELAPYRDSPHAGGQVATTAKDIAAAVEAQVTEMEKRYPLLQGRGLRDLADGRRGGLDLPYVVLVVDELADLLMQAPSAEDHLVRIAQKGRAAGIHLILATQRPDAQTFRGLLRSNVPARVALAVQRTSESQIILGEPGAQALIPPGDMLVRWASGDRIRAHGYDLRPDDVAHVVRASRRSST